MKAYITICTDDKYVPGVLALNRSLRKTKTVFPLYLLCTDSISLSCVKQLEKEEVQIIKAAPICPSDYVRKQNQLNGSPNWNNTFFKLHIFGLTQFEKLIYLDSDMIVLTNIDNLFDKPHMSAVQAGHGFNSSWSQLNSGLMVICPSKNLELKLLSLVCEKPDPRMFNGKGIGDQDIINWYYMNWLNQEELHLPEIYNQFVTLIPQYLREKKIHSFDEIKVLHFVGKNKPWNYNLKDYVRIVARSFRHHSLNEFDAIRIFRSFQ